MKYAISLLLVFYLPLHGNFLLPRVRFVIRSVLRLALRFAFFVALCLLCSRFRLLISPLIIVIYV